MSDDVFTAILLDDDPALAGSPAGELGNRTVIDIEPDRLRRLIGSQISVSSEPAGLADLVPLAQTISSKISESAMNKAGDAGHNVPCGKGCGACCSYMVPLSAPEALHIGRDIGPLSESSDPDTAEALAKAAGRIINSWPESPLVSADGDDGDMMALGKWYASLDLQCPFLSRGTCTIYDKRPIACREHAVIGSAGDCAGFDPARGNRLEMPFKTLEALGQLAADLEQTEVQAVMMPLAPFWYEANRHRATPTWPGPELVMRFLDLLARTAAKTGVTKAA